MLIIIIIKYADLYFSVKMKVTSYQFLLLQPTPLLFSSVAHILPRTSMSQCIMLQKCSIESAYLSVK